MIEILRELDMLVQIYNAKVINAYVKSYRKNLA